MEVLPTSPEADVILRRYYEDIGGRYHGRVLRRDEVDQIMTDFPSDDLVRPSGVFLLAAGANGPVGCVGVRVYSADVVELTRMYVDGAARGQGVAARLLAAAEEAGRSFGARALWLNTRSDLVEARALYAKHGFTEIPPFGDDPYAQHWLGKDLTPAR
ncbi:GNAT family N-acetyltransferase [Amycolatopsis suaedae]|uniref:GNAT family N-acetyltransferase n=1 Tax=Amycolatopsis suaedae TaxID=2510978 RepID=A0A4Q7J538_9PSEU|nr:GNAT family N-acetyltransferase [Amycolatopsis suaedae]RZQ62177.1 GNAT family N-acetyltransferase [Amycolatopsis suaedae]